MKEWDNDRKEHWKGGGVKEGKGKPRTKEEKAKV